VFVVTLFTAVVSSAVVARQENRGFLGFSIFALVVLLALLAVSQYEGYRRRKANSANYSFLPSSTIFPTFEFEQQV
jgi:hypothetical protein